MTRDQLLAQVRANTGRTDKDANILIWLDLGLGVIGREYDFEALVSQEDLSIATDDLSVELPSGTHHLLEARLINGTLSYKLGIYPKNQIVKYWPNVVSMNTGIPVNGYLENGTIFFIPPSNGSYTVRVTISSLPEALGSGGTQNPLPVADDALIAYATMSLFRSIQMFPAAQEWERVFRTSLNSAIQSDRRQHAREFIAGQVGDIAPTSSTPWTDPFSGLEGIP